MILVIDDVKTFPFSDDYIVEYSRTLTDGIKMLELCESQVFGLEELWLDHDLGGDDTIRPLCLMLAERAFNGNPYPVGRIVICSLNPVGMKWMWSTLSPYYNLVAGNDPRSVCDILNIESGQIKWS